MKKIEVKDYYAIKRGKARSSLLTKEQRAEVARKASQARWENYLKENEEDKKYRKKITK